MRVGVSVSLPHEDLEWYKAAYPEGSLSSVLTLMLRQFRSIHEDTGVTPIKVARDAAREAKSILDEGLKEA